MLSIILGLFFVCVLGIVFTLVADFQIERLPPDNKFRIWWKNNVIGDDIYSDDF
jgi:hypothetical protein